MAGISFRLATLGLLITSLAHGADPRGVEFFESKIRPALTEHCLSCHSAEAKAAKKLRGGLFLDSAAGLTKGGDSGPAIVPGKPASSLLISSLKHTDDLRMPPKGKLSDSLIADFEKWVAMGAPDPRETSAGAGKQTGLSLEEGKRFWAYQPVRPRAASLPAIADDTAEIDRFVRDRLRTAQLPPAPEADRATLMRRLRFDLTGLPPTPAEIDEFVADTRPDAVARVVDRLLASREFAERWARHWLDLARYAESLSLRGFVLKEAWRYRDYAIDSFVGDLPFDTFVREQIAGDLLDSPDWETRRRRIIATTFLAMGNNNLEEQDKKQLDMDVADEQLDTLGRTFLSQTIACARCHDHKFDPIPTRDYYALAGILRSTRFLKHENVSNWIDRPLPMDPAREELVKAREEELAGLQKQIADLRAVVAKNQPAGNPLKPRVRQIKDLPGIVVDDTKAKKVGVWKESVSTGSFVGEGYLHDEAVGKGEKTLTFAFDIPASGKYEVWFAYSAASNRCDATPVTVVSAEGDKTLRVNEQKPPEMEGLFHSLGTYAFEKGGQGFVLVDTAQTKGHVVADAVLFIPAGQAKPVAKPESKNSPAPSGEETRLRQLEEQLKKRQEAGPKRDMALGFEEAGKASDLRVHIRGSIANLGPVAPRGFLQVAMWSPSNTLPDRQSGRRELAEWMADARNPLTARVYVNRVWHWLLGAGLVRTTDNFGTTGETPSHPELLDHLARRFVESGWSTKKLIRMIVLSQTYRQASDATPAARKSDPENRLLSHANRRRVDAESLRDAILFTSGELRPFAGGPTYKPELSSDYRYQFNDPIRSIYVPVFRNSLPEIFELFDFANPSVTNGRRDTSTSAPQALFMTNHPFVLEQSRRAAARLNTEHPDNDDRWIDAAHRRFFGHSATKEETAIIRKYLAGSGTRDELRAKVIQALFASVDFRYVN